MPPDLKRKLIDLVGMAFDHVPGTTGIVDDWADVTEDESKELDLLATHLEEALQILRKF